MATLDIRYRVINHVKQEVIEEFDTEQEALDKLAECQNSDLEHKEDFSYQRLINRLP